LVNLIADKIGCEKPKVPYDRIIKRLSGNLDFS
jgi:hypothetical protein